MRPSRPKSTQDWWVHLGNELDTPAAQGCVLVQATVTRYHKPWLEQQRFISHSSGGQTSTIRVLASLGSGESSLPGLQSAAFLQYPHMAERERSSSSHVSPSEDANPIMRASSQSPASKCQHTGIRTSACEFGRHKHSSHSRQGELWLEVGLK